MTKALHLPLALASGSSYRRMLLNKLNLDFAWAAPNINESTRAGEQPEQLVQRLATEKATALAERFPAHLIIGSDQVATCEGRILGKPGTTERAIEQLTSFSGKKVSFLTGLCVLNSSTMETDVLCEPFSVVFRELDAEEISNYVRLEQPLDCAGSFKSENLGITLFSKMQGDDPNSLVGLPVIQLLRLLRKWGLNPLKQNR